MLGPFSFLSEPPLSVIGLAPLGLKKLSLMKSSPPSARMIESKREPVN
ncbi:hypothetical protein M2192_006058 [Bradyrhizobium elkanii USDA 61]|uniref:Uncharacterized protein n=1 Tax=Bradyrhizobium elkanii TaxID=29448 RepID=A0A8I2C2P3_BRAEL|nr:hypothetical protein [Bradyrhizobium elkanii]MCS4009098.1 hypothetical protein [Bradyrhizobium elkanii USDA 61]MCP1927580.1 hypothetical protein [Bradyrhizobium elkanii]MCS3474905.1 hypothetical protein [Bradyrhizobium elkanii]MCS3581811.1 hypothetical protein [Bradyrhizobium elkanii]